MSYPDDPDRTRELPANLDPRGRGDDDDRTRAMPRQPSSHPQAPREPYRGAAYDPRYDRGYPVAPGSHPPQGYRPDQGYPPAAPPATPARRKRRRGPVRRVLSWFLVVLLLAIVGFAAYLDFSLKRDDVLKDYADRPAASPGTTWLLVGSDARDDLTEKQKKELATGDAGGKRTDTIMLLHIPDSNTPPSLVSLPRDTLVDIPGKGKQKLNAAFAFGGGSLLAQTVEKHTGMRIDRYAEIGFGGFAGIVDSIGGVRMCLDEPMNDPKAGLDLKAGCQTLNGAQALGYVRTRASANADLDRVERQRKFLSALLSKAASGGTLANPFRSIPLALKSTGTLTVDDGAHLWHLASMGFALGHARLVTTTVPIAGTPTISGIGSVVKWDEAKAKQMFDALRADKAIPVELVSKG